MNDEELTAFDVIRLHDQCSRDSCMEKYDNPETPIPCAFFTRGDTGNEDGPMSFAREYIVYPINYREITWADRNIWCIYVIHTGWGWAVKDGSGGQGHTLTKKGEWLYESRGHKQNKSRRFTFEEAMRRAKIAVDKRTVMGQTAAGSMDAIRVGSEVQVRVEDENGLSLPVTHKLEKWESDDERKLYVITLDNGVQFLSTSQFHKEGRRFYANTLPDGNRRILGTKRAFEVAFPETEEA